MQQTDLKDITNRWLARNTKIRGVVACGVRYADQTTFNQAMSPSFPPVALDNSWACVAGTFQLLMQHQADVRQMCWVFENYLLYCAIRDDNACLGIFTIRAEGEYDPAAINRMISEFKGLRGGRREPAA